MCTVLWVFFVARDDDGSAINEMREEGEFIYMDIIYIIWWFSSPCTNLKNTQNYFSFCYFPFYNFHIQKSQRIKLTFHMCLILCFYSIFFSFSLCNHLAWWWKCFTYFAILLIQSFIFMKINIILFCINLCYNQIHLNICCKTVRWNKFDWHAFYK